MFNHDAWIGRVFMALYASEGWYDLWQRGEHARSHYAVYSKARAMVIYDRVLNNDLRIDTVIKPDSRFV